MTEKVFLPTVCVHTKNEYLYRRIEIELSGIAKAVRYSGKEEFDLLLTDTDTEPKAEAPNAYTMSRGTDTDIFLPLPLGKIKNFVLDVLSGKEDAPPLSLGDRCAFLFGHKIKLTELEYSLLSSLYERRGKFVSRDELLSSVWKNSCDGGIINVYIHYLREKLEKHGEKIIISSRKHGYKIDGRFFGGEDNA